MGTRQDEEHLRRGVCQGAKRRLEVIGRIFQLQRMNLQAENLCPILGGVELVGGDGIVDYSQARPVGSRLQQQLRLLFRQFGLDRKSTRLNSSHLGISYAVFCLKKKK